MTHTHSSPAAGTATARRRPLMLFLAAALPIGWLLLSVPVALDLPSEPFALGVVLLGLLAPAIALTYRDSGRAGVATLLRDAVRLPRPRWWVLVAALAVPAIAWNLASVLGGARPLTLASLSLFAADLVIGLVVVNLWEELAWTGFLQRRAIDAWGPVNGSLFAAAGFAGVHLPLAFADASRVGDVLIGIAVLMVTAVGLRLMITGLDAWTGGSLLTVGILHASFNATYELIDPGYDWIRLGTALVLGLLAVGFFTRQTR